MTNDPSRFCVLKSVYVDGRAHHIKGVRVSGEFVYVTLAEITDRNAAELLRGKYMTIDRAAAVPLDDGEFFVADLIGATLIASTSDGERSIGKIRAVQSFGAADVFEVDCTDGRAMSFAFVKALAARFDSEKNILAVDGDKLEQVAVYDED